ncbi:MAG: radical SAM protein [Selenomonadaceae bacterium]|nr:radical SAM protein [Selenomonadaceae bacterium]
MQIILKLTTACNLNCVYCSEGDCAAERLPEEIFYKLVDEMPQLLEHVKSQRVEFLFHGGEPMLYGRDALKKLIDYALENLRDYKVEFLMQTNGTLIDSEWVEFFKREKIDVGISLDGYPEIHDANRRTKNNEPTAEKILSNIKLMREAGLNVGTLMVLNSAQNIDVDKLFDFINENDLQPKIHSVIPCGRASSREDTEQVYDDYVELMKKLLAKSLSLTKPKIIEPLDEIINAILGVSPMHECSFNGSCAKSFICLYPDGETGFCGRDNFSRLLTYGNLREKNLTDLYESANAKKIRARQNYLTEHDCKNCSDWELCHGGCAFEAVNYYGTLDAKYANCQSRKNFLAWLKTEGLQLLKAALIREKTRLRKSIKLKKEFCKEIDNLKVADYIGRT